MARAVDDLPAPVARYLKRALAGDARPIVRATLQQTGRLRRDVASKRWLPFTASETATPTSHGFVWDAQVALLPFLRLRVRDALADGRAEGRVRLCSVIPLVSARDTPELNAGALHRYLAESVWWPTALLPSRALAWRPIDATRALATLSVRDTRVELEFRFDADGDVAAIHTPARWGLFDGRYEQRGWEGHFSGWTNHAGLRIPLEGEVGWYDGSAWQPVWSGAITQAEYLRG